MHIETYILDYDNGFISGESEAVSKKTDKQTRFLNLGCKISVVY